MKVCGTTYKEGAVVLTKFINDMPIFGRIITIILHSSTEPLIVTNLLETVFFNKHFFAYQVKDNYTNSYYVCKQSKLADYHPLSFYSSQNSIELLVPLKYHVLSDFDL